MVGVYQDSCSLCKCILCEDELMKGGSVCLYNHLAEWSYASCARLPSQLGSHLRCLALPPRSLMTIVRTAHNLRLVLHQHLRQIVPSDSSTIFHLILFSRSLAFHPLFGLILCFCLRLTDCSLVFSLCSFAL